MYTQSLLSYSIDHSTKVSLPSPQITLPPLHSLCAHNGNHAVLHPPSSTLHQFAAHGRAIIPLPTSLVKAPHFQLTEKNLGSNNYYSGIPSPPKSISSVGTASPVSLPSLHRQPSHLNLYEPTSTSQQPQPQSQYFQEQVEPEKKRRQRAGPSCDSCRQRKVKCNAEIQVLTSNADEFRACFDRFGLPEADFATLLDGTAVTLSPLEQLTIQNCKLVRFTSCKSCESKQIDCHFSKGFTKEDIMVMAKRPTTMCKVVKPSTASQPFAATAIAAACIPVKLMRKPAEKRPREGGRSRKLSCTLCRQSKVKCVSAEGSGKCEVCLKKKKTCSFDC